MKKHQKPLADQIRDIIVKMTHTDPSWAYGLALAIISVIIGKKIKIPFKKQINLNIYVIVIGISGAGKTLPLNFVVKPLLDFLHASFSDTFTIEGLITEIKGIMDEDQATWIHEPKSSGTIIRDEISDLFNEPKFRKQIPTFLSKLWSNSSFSNATRSIGKEIVPETSISLIGATSPEIFNYLKREHFVQGLANRILWLIFGEQYVRGHTVQELFPDDIERKRFDSEKDSMMKTLEKITKAKYPHSLLHLTDKAKQLLVKAENELIKKGKSILLSNPTDIKGGYYMHTPANLIKLAGLIAISREYQKIISGNQIEITKADVQKAITFIKQSIANVKIIVSHLRSSHQKKAKFSNAEISAAKTYILATWKVGKFISLNRLTQNMIWNDNKKTKSIANQLIQDGFLKIEKQGSKNRYKRMK